MAGPETAIEKKIYYIQGLNIRAKEGANEREEERERDSNVLKVNRRIIFQFFIGTVTLKVDRLSIPIISTWVPMVTGLQNYPIGPRRIALAVRTSPWGLPKCKISDSRCHMNPLDKIRAETRAMN